MKKSFEILFFILVSMPIILFSPESIVLYFQNFSSPFFTTLAIIFQYLATFYVYAAFLFVLFALNISARKLLFASFSYFLVSIVVQILKRIIFPHYLRPHAVLELGEKFFGCERNMSLPSGHAATIFTFVVVISILFFKKNYFISLSLLIVAFMLSLSRIYMAMHFYRDVYIGALIGLFLSKAASYLFFCNLKNIDKLDLPIHSFLKFLTENFLKK